MNLDMLVRYEWAGSTKLLKTLDDGDIDELETAIKHGYYAERGLYGYDHMQVARMLQVIENADGRSGKYTEKCRDMAIQLLQGIPDLKPQIRWEKREDRGEEIYGTRVYAQNLVEFCGFLGKDPALFEALYSLIGQPQMQAEVTGFKLENALVSALSKTQTDRRLQPTWDDMLNERHLQEMSQGSFYRAQLNGCFHEGYDAMVLLPPLSGDPKRLATDIFAYATDRLVHMMDSEAHHGFAISTPDFRKAESLMGELFIVSNHYSQEPVGNLFCGIDRALWPEWAKITAEAVEGSSYSLLEPAHLEEMYQEALIARAGAAVRTGATVRELVKAA